MICPEAILDAITCIEMHGLEGVTPQHIRDICARRGLPELPGPRLLELALDATIENSMPDIAEILRAPGELDERLEALLAFLADGAQRYPNLARAHLRSGRYVFHLSRLVRQLLSDEPLDGGVAHHELMEGLALAMSAAIFLGLSGGALSPLRIATVPRQRQTSAAVRSLMRLVPLGYATPTPAM